MTAQRNRTAPSANPAKGRDVHTTVNGHVGIREINRRGLSKVAQRHFGVA